MTTYDDLVTAAEEAAQKPQSVRNDKLSLRNHSLKEWVEFLTWKASVDAVSSAATQVDAETAVMAGVRTNTISPGGAV
jgi:hypothetical protein